MQAFEIDDDDDDCFPHHDDNTNNKDVLKNKYKNEEVNTSSSCHHRTIDAFLEQAYHSHHPYHHHHQNPQHNNKNSPLRQCFANNNNNTIIQHTQRWRYYLVMICLGTANMTNEAQYSCMKFMLSDATFQSELLNNGDGKLGAFLAGIIALAQIVGGAFAIGFEQRWELGRKPTLLIGLSFNVLGGLGLTIASNYVFMCFARFISGVGIGININSVTSLATELSPPNERGCFVSFIDSHWSIGGIWLAVVAWLVLGVWGLHWRVFLGVCGIIPPLVSFCLVYWFVPESPRHVALVRGEYGKAVDILNLLADYMGYRCRDDMMMDDDDDDDHEDDNRAEETNNDKSDYNNKDVIPTQSSSSSSFGSKLTVEEVRHHFEPTIHHHHQRSHSSSSFRSNLVLVYSNKHQRLNTIGLQIIWICISSTDTLSMWINALFAEENVPNLYISSLLVAVSTLPGNMLSILLVDRVGRKTLYGVVMALIAFTLAYFSRVATNPQQHDAEEQQQQAAGDVYTIVILACVFNSLLSAAWNINTVMTGELFPTKLRFTGYTLCATGGRLSNFMVQFVNGTWMDRPGLQVGVACVFAGVASIMAFCFPMDEMAKHAIEEDVTITSNDDRDDDGNVVRTAVNRMEQEKEDEGGLYLVNHGLIPPIT